MTKLYDEFGFDTGMPRLALEGPGFSPTTTQRAFSTAGSLAAGGSHFTEKFDRRDDARTIHSVDHVPNLDRRGAEEVYHLVSFRVKDDRGHWSDWTQWKKSDVVEVRR